MIWSVLAGVAAGVLLGTSGLYLVYRGYKWGYLEAREDIEDLLEVLSCPGVTEAAERAHAQYLHQRAMCMSAPRKDLQA